MLPEYNQVAMLPEYNQVAMLPESTQVVCLRSGPQLKKRIMCFFIIQFSFSIIGCFYFLSPPSAQIQNKSLLIARWRKVIFLLYDQFTVISSSS